MTVRYITVTPVTNFFKPATRAFGDIAIVGDTSDDATGPVNIAIPVTNPDSVSDPNDPASAKNKKAVDSADWFQGPLGSAVRTAFGQSPGPSLVWAIRTDEDVADSFAVVGKLDVQIVMLADKPLNDANSADVKLLASHVATLSGAGGGDGKERIGVTMLDKTAAASTAAGLVAGLGLSVSRMVVVAHKSDGDAAAAVAGTIAGYEPHISLILKPVGLTMANTFDDSEIETLNSAGVNWLTRPTLIPGTGLYMGEGYISGSANVRYIDIIRTLDDVTFRLKAQLIQSIGVLRINRPGIRSLESQMASVLEPLKQREVIDNYDIFLPVLVLLDKDPATLSDLEAQELKNIRNSRTVDSIITVTYAGAIHRLNITLKFQ